MSRLGQRQERQAQDFHALQVGLQVGNTRADEEGAREAGPQSGLRPLTWLQAVVEMEEEEVVVEMEEEVVENPAPPGLAPPLPPSPSAPSRSGDPREPSQFACLCVCLSMYF